MELSYYLAQLTGLTLALFALLGILRPRFIDEVVRGMKASTPLVNLLFGFLAVVAGLAIILAHNVWETSWRVVITLVGWASLLKGLMFLINPGFLARLGRGVYSGGMQTKLVLFIALVLGAYIAYKGFGN